MGNHSEMGSFSLWLDIVYLLIKWLRLLPHIAVYWFYCSVIHLSQAHFLELRRHLVMFQSGFTFTVNWHMHKSVLYLWSSIWSGHCLGPWPVRTSSFDSHFQHSDKLFSYEPPLPCHLSFANYGQFFWQFSTKFPPFAGSKGQQGQAPYAQLPNLFQVPLIWTIVAVLGKCRHVHGFEHHVTTKDQHK